MDATYFLKSRTEFIRFFYAEGAKGFHEMKHQITNGLPPFDDPPYSEDPEPAFLEEWMDADAAIDILGISCVSMLSDSLKLYFNTLEKRVIRFSFESPKAAFKNGFVHAYLRALGEILDIDWKDCPVDLDLIEQIALARNRAQHGEDLTSFAVTHNEATLKKHPKPVFVSEDDSWILTAGEGSLASLLMPTLKVTEESLFKAIAEVESFAAWIETLMDRAASWHSRQRGGSSGS